MSDTPGPAPDPAVPTGGYAVPAHPHFPAGEEPVWGALVPSPRGGLGALWQRFTRTMQRSGRTVALLLLVTNALPQFVGTVGMELLGARASVVTDPLSRSDRELVAIGGGLALLMLAWGLVTIWLAAWGSACCS